MNFKFTISCKDGKPSYSDDITIDGGLYDYHFYDVLKHRMLAAIRFTELEVQEYQEQVKNTKNKHAGSSFDSFLKEEGLKDE